MDRSQKRLPRGLTKKYSSMSRHVLQNSVTDLIDKERNHMEVDLFDIPVSPNIS